MLKRSSLLTSLSFFCSPCQKCKRQSLWLVRCSKSEIARKLLITQNRKNYQKRKNGLSVKTKHSFSANGNRSWQDPGRIGGDSQKRGGVEALEVNNLVVNTLIVKLVTTLVNHFVANTFVVNPLVVTTLSTLWLLVGLSITLVVIDAWSPTWLSLP